jgi:hypothetical protein
MERQIIGGWMDGQMDICMGGNMYGWIGGQTDG